MQMLCVQRSARIKLWSGQTHAGSRPHMHCCQPESKVSVVHCNCCTLHACGWHYVYPGCLDDQANIRESYSSSVCLGRMRALMQHCWGVTECISNRNMPVFEQHAGPSIAPAVAWLTEAVRSCSCSVACCAASGSAGALTASDTLVLAAGTVTQRGSAQAHRQHTMGLSQASASAAVHTRVLHQYRIVSRGD
jgi:hypothetical protein